MTQQNAALVEESAAAAESLKDQAHPADRDRVGLPPGHGRDGIGRPACEVRGGAPTDVRRRVTCGALEVPEVRRAERGAEGSPLAEALPASSAAAPKPLPKSSPKPSAPVAPPPPRPAPAADDGDWGTF